MELPIPIPPADEQWAILHSITAKSAAIEELIADARQSTRLLRERRTTLIAAAITGQIDVRPVTPLDTALTEIAADIAY